MIRIIIRMPGGKLKRLPPGCHFQAFAERLMYDHNRYPFGAYDKILRNLLTLIIRTRSGYQHGIIGK